MSKRGIVVDGTENARLVRAGLRIEEFRGFVQDLIDDPTTLDLVPDGSTLELRRVSVHGQYFRLTAYRPIDSGELWSARVTSYLGRSTSELSLEGTNDAEPWAPGARLPPGVGEIITSGETAAAALDALYEKLTQVPFSKAR